MEQNNQKQFHDKLKKKIDEYVHLVYAISKNFPKEELYGATSQLRRATLSVMLNYIEGYARQRNKVYINFLETSYGSLKESSYLLEFSYVERYITNKEDFKKVISLANEIGAMLWGTIKAIKS